MIEAVFFRKGFFTQFNKRRGEKGRRGDVEMKWLSAGEDALCASEGVDVSRDVY